MTTLAGVAGVVIPVGEARVVLAPTAPLPAANQARHARPMFAVTEAEAALIRTAMEERGELSAAIELRRIFPGIEDNAKARECARIIAGWAPIVAPPATVTRLRTKPRG